MENCHCGSNRAYEQCCGPFIAGDSPAPTAEALMRARYSAFATAAVDYILDTVHPDKRAENDPRQIQNWAKKSDWLGLEIIRVKEGQEADEQGEVEFAAIFRENNRRARHHEIATFKKDENIWYFYDAQTPKTEPLKRVSPKVGRNSPCPCGSGKKYKKCCDRQ